MMTPDPCFFCDNEHKHVYVDNKNGIGRIDPKFSGGLVAVPICDECLRRHLKWAYPDSHMLEGLKK